MILPPTVWYCRSAVTHRKLTTKSIRFRQVLEAQFPVCSGAQLRGSGFNTVSFRELSSKIIITVAKKKKNLYFFFFLFFLTFYNCIVPMGFLPWEIRVAFPGESQLQQSRATRPTVHAECFSVSLIHQTLTWTTRSLTCAQM